MIAWGHPAAAWSLAVLAGAAVLAIVLARGRRQRMRRLAADAAWAAMLPDPVADRPRARAVLRWTALLLTAAALARPQWGEDEIEVERHGLDVMVLLDVSNSMLAGDLRPNRLQQARWGLRDLLPHLGGDRLGLTVFAGDAQVLCPLTIDHGTFLMMLDDASPEIVARGGTAIARALRVAIDALGPPAEADRVILLVSDGEDHEEDPLDLVDRLRALDIRVFAVGVGDPRGAPLAIGTDGAEGGFMRDREGRVVHTRLDERLLQDLALQTGGGYVRAVPGDFGLDRLYREAMADLRRAAHETRRHREPIERFGWLLAAALGCLAFELALRVLGRPKRAGGRAAAAVLLLLAAGPAAAATPRALMDEGLRAYARGEFAAAAEAFSRAADEAEGSRLDPAHARYNASLALARAGRYADAAAMLAEAARTTDPEVQARAHFGRGRSLAAEAERRVAAGAREDALSALEEAVAAYERAIRLDPGDRDAKVNYELARRRLDALRIEEEPQPPDPEPRPEPEPEPGDSDPEEDPAPPEPEPGDEDPPEEPPEPGDEGEETPDPAEPSPDVPAREGTPSMSEDEALALLDVLRDEEAAERERARRPRPSPVPVEKDW